MTTQFCFEHVFRAPSVTAVFDAYFDPTNVLQQDKQLEIIERTVLEFVDDGATLRRRCKIVPRRQLPAFMRAFIQSPLHYVETATWDRADNRIDISTRLSLQKSDKPAITGVYRLSLVSAGSIHRRFEGTVSVDVPLIASKIERSIVAEYERSMPVAAVCTQAFLDREDRSLSAQA